MFPARAGMSPEPAFKLSSGNRVPRASGDEPTTSANKESANVCSPRERG